MGGALSSEHAHSIASGAETLPLRLDRASQTALALAQYLQAHPAVAAVHYALLPSHPQHARAQKLFKAGTWLMAFELRDTSLYVRAISALPIRPSMAAMAARR